MTMSKKLHLGRFQWFVTFALSGIALLLMTYSAIACGSGKGQFFQPDLLAAKLRRGMSSEQCFSSLGLADSVELGDSSSIMISEVGYASYLHPQHQITLVFVDDKLDNVFVKWSKGVHEQFYSFWPHSQR
jgi:hypothetical protein